jgi:hypothetical protein
MIVAQIVFSLVSHRRPQQKRVDLDNNRHETMHRLRPKLRAAASIAGASLALGCTLTEQSLGKPGSSTSIGDSAGSADPTESATDDPDSEAEVRWVGHELWASDGHPGDGFGLAIAVDGDTLVVASAHDPDFGRPIGSDDNYGAAYVFVRSGDVWIEQQKLVPRDAHAVGSVAIDGDTLVVGTSTISDPVGIAYVFVRSDGVWTERQKLASDNAYLPNVAVSGDTSIVNRTFFVRNGEEAWTERQTAEDSLVGDRPSVMVNDRWSVLGRTVFLDDEGGWEYFQDLSLEEPVAPAHDMGVGPVGIDADTNTMVLLRQEAIASGEVLCRGTAIVFVQTAAHPEWREQAQFTSAWYEGWAPASAALSGDTLVMATPRGEGALELVRSGSTWTRQPDLPRPDRDNWGSSIAMNEDTLFVGAPAAEAQGSVWVHRRVEGSD